MIFTMVFYSFPRRLFGKAFLSGVRVVGQLGEGLPRVQEGDT
jgi:hypothetical protein